MIGPLYNVYEEVIINTIARTFEKSTFQFQYSSVLPIEIVFGLLYVTCHCNRLTYQKVTDKAIETTFG